MVLERHFHPFCTNVRTLDSTESLSVHHLMVCDDIGDDGQVCSRNTTSAGITASLGASGKSSLLKLSVFAIFSPG